MAKEILTERQRVFLEKFGQEEKLREKFYLTGGTVLAGFYLHHRYSEDLDFFNEQDFEVEGIQVFFKKIQPTLGYSTIDSQQSYNRNLFFLKFDDEILKIEFTYFPFPRIEPGIVESGVHIDSLIDIATNKLFTIYQQPRARDYIDLYLICQEKNWQTTDLVKQAKVKFDWHVDPLQLGTQFMKAREVKDYPRMLKDLTPKSWQDFFIQEAKNLRPQILT